MPRDLSQLDWASFTGRSLGPLDPAAAASIPGKSVLITGAGGFIGSALARTVASLRPSRLLLLDQAEAGLASLQATLPAFPFPVEFIVGDIADTALMRDIGNQGSVPILFHAAARKHVPLLESNPFAAAAVNALGTSALLHSAQQSGVKNFVLLSTDKAVEPVSILGATKRIAELCVLLHNGAMATTALRLCNILGSTGSVAPALVRQIQNGAPLTLTAPNATRYFLSVGEAVQHLLTVLSFGASRSLWIPCRGEPQRITDLAEFLSSALNNNPDNAPDDAPDNAPDDVPDHAPDHAPDNGRHSPAVDFVGLRPGDKLAERLFSPDEHPCSCAAPGLRRVHTPLPTQAELASGLDLLAGAVQQRSLPRLLAAVGSLVPAYRPSPTLLRGLPAAHGKGAPA